MLEKTFGVKLAGVTYRDRVGAYGVVFRAKNQVAAIRTSRGFFLPGGGIEGDETHEECIVRESLEEAGLAVAVMEFIGKGETYHRWSDRLRYHMHGIGYFYHARLIEIVAVVTEADHELVWLDIAECVQNLFPEHQRWAVEQATLQRAAWQ